MYATISNTFQNYNQKLADTSTQNKLLCLKSQYVYYTLLLWVPTWAAIKGTSNYPCYFICKAAILLAIFHRRAGKVLSTTTFLFGHRIYIKFY